MAGRQNLPRFRYCRIQLLPVIVEYRPGINTRARVAAGTLASSCRPHHTAHIGEASVLSAERYHKNPPLNGLIGFHLQACIHQSIATLRLMRRHYWPYTVKTDEIY